MDITITDVRSLMTVLQVVVFGAIVWWAYSSGRKSRFEAASQIPLHDDDDFPVRPKTENHKEHGSEANP